MIKKIARSIVVAILGFQTKRLIKKHHPTIIAVVGSIGKTSTKRAIAEVLGKTLKVQYQSGNYNDLATVPLVLFGQEMPALFNPFGWIRVFVRNEIQLAKPYPYDVAVVELGTDGPGQIKAFSRYLNIDIAVVTALTPEHMEFFENLDAVIAEELSVTTFADKVIINADFAPVKYINSLNDPITYAIKGDANFRATDISYGVESSSVKILKDTEPFMTASLPLFSEAQMYSALAASVVWDAMQLPTNELSDALQAISPVPGRMQLLRGINGATIIDDSYNASPEAMKSALDTLYRLPGSHRIALLGNMNELGDFGVEAHSEIGEYCDPSKLDEIVTLGPEANAYLAPAAQAKSCKVTTFDSPYEAGEYLKSVIPENAIVLIKGSQNKVFAEETVKLLLANPADETKLVRQSKDWLAVKKKQFHA